ncbi:MAG: ABC transporter permease [Verrucomicrobiota bacterium]
MNKSLRNVWIVYRRELCSHFDSSLAYVFIIVFLLLSVGLGFLFNRFLENDQASLEAFFMFHPWLFMVLAPAVGMRLWSDEHRTGTIELLLTMPIAVWEAIVGKFLAAFTVLAFAIVLTFPTVVTVQYLGDPDYGPIIASYVSSLLFAGVCLAITSMVSSMSRSLVAALVASVAICFLLILIGLPPTTDFFTSVMGGAFAEGLAELSILRHFIDMQRGVITLQNLYFYVAVIAFCLFTTSVIIRAKRA